jgi:zinc finger protein 830
MADVRALLRQQRAARRVEHPHASYSDSGKLVCTVCSEHVKTESLWDGHLRGAGHRQRLQRLHQELAKKGANGYAGFVDESAGGNDPVPASHKRKLSGSDEDMVDQEDEARRKRTRPDPSAEPSQQETSTPAKKNDSQKPGKPVTPPLGRRTSGTPTAGIEMQIPSRPATPSAGGTPMATTPKAAPIGRSPLIPDEATVSQQEAIRGTKPTSGSSGSAAAAAPAPVPVDEDEWAAFEADLVHGTGAKGSAKPAAAAALDSDAVISAPVMSAAELAAKSEEEERARRRALVDIQIEDEKEDATRALETEFDVMEELEARARKLRERREALRLQSNSGAAPAVASDGEKKAAASGKENAAVQEDEDDEDDEEDDWDGFRFRA